MDETGAANQDSPQETGQASGSQEGNTSTGNATYTKIQVDKMVSDAKAEQGRTFAEERRKAEASSKDLESLREELRETRQLYNDLLDEKQRAEYELIKDNPKAINLYERERRYRERDAEMRERQRELDRRDLELKASLDEMARLRKDQTASEIAVRAGVEKELLLSLTDGTPEKMEALAKILPKKDAPPAGTNIRPDSGMTSGSYGPFTMDQLDVMSMERFAEEYKKGNIK